MEFITFTLLLSVFTWSLFYDLRLIYIFSFIVVIYVIFDLIARRNARTSLSQKLRIANWDDMGEPTSIIKLNVELETVDQFLMEYNKQNPDNPLSYIHFAARSMAEAVSFDKNYSGKICLGNFYYDDSVKFTVMDRFINSKGEEEFKTVFLDDVKNKNLKDIQTDIKKGIEEDYHIHMGWVTKVPFYIVDWIVRLSFFISYEIGLPMKFFNIRKNHFGYGFIINTGAYDIQNLVYPLINVARTPFIVTIGKPFKKPKVVDGKLVIKKLLQFNVTGDHRFGDGSYVRTMIQKMKAVWAKPEEHI